MKPNRKHISHNEKMKIFTVYMPTRLLEFLDKLVESGLIPSKNEWMRQTLVDKMLEIHPRLEALCRGNNWYEEAVALLQTRKVNDHIWHSETDPIFLMEEE